ncbi:DEKNAAC102578, partial [Brettanomyces naardenensis]
RQIPSLNNDMTDKIGEKQLYETLKSKFVGLGNADTKRKEFIRNVKIDTYSALATSDPMVEQLSVALNKPKGLVKQDLIEKMAKS